MQKIIKRYLTGGEKIIVLGLASIVFGIIFTSSAFAATMNTDVNIRPSMTLSVSTNDITLNLNPATKPFDSKDFSITIGTNNPSGYNLYLNADDTNLVNVDDSTKIIETLPSSTPASGYDQSSFPANYWGYRKSNGSTSSGNYFPYATNLLVSSASGPSNEITTSIGLASKIDYLKDSGVYKQNFNLNAIPIVTNYTMQELGTNSTLAAEVCTESPTVVVDSRDNQTYTISKLKDGNCWMTQNLKIGKYTDSLTMTQADSNVGASGFTLENTTNGKLTTTNSSISCYYCQSEYGCWYNWYTATASSGAISMTSGEASYSICPAGWRLPTGGANGEFKALVDLYGGSNTTTASAVLVANPSVATENINGVYMPGFLLSGWHEGTEPSGQKQGEQGYYWSSSAAPMTSNNLPAAYYLQFSSNNVYPTYSHAQFVGRSVRCLLSGV